MDRPRPRADDRGAAAVEFALICVPLLVLVMAIIQFGLAYESQMSVSQAARTGARLAALCGTTCDQGALTTSIQNASPGISDTSNISASFQYCANGGSCTAGSFCPTGASAATGSEQVTVTYPYAFGKPLAAVPVTITGKGSFPCGG